MRALVAGACFVCLAWGCANYSEQELYAQEDQLNRAIEQYDVRKQRCKQLGGAMLLRAPRLQDPAYQDYNLAKCVRY